MELRLLAEGEDAEQAEPERTHGVPVPGNCVDHDLAVFDALEGEEADDCGEEASNSGGEMEGVSVGDDVERMATAAARFERRSEYGELMPCEHLAGEEERPEGQCCEQPGQRTARGGLAEAEPLFHGVDLVKHVAACELDRDGTEQQDGGVEPEDRRDGGGEPGVDVVVVGVDVVGGLREEDADDANEEHEDGAEGE